ncbi:MAG: RNA polymerase factor sigma-54, partial [Pyrinomonadaceae bacterium]
EEQSADSFDEVDFDREFREYLDPGYKTQERDYDPDAPSFEQFLSRPPSLSEHLLWQLGMVVDEGPLREVAKCVIGNLDSDGRLAATNEEIASLCHSTHEIIEEARRLVITLEPIGCGSCDVRECLLAQLEAQGEQDTVVYDLVRDHLFDLHPNRLPVLAKQTGLSTDELNRHLETIRELDPFPGRRYSANEAIQIVPEIFIEKVEGEYVIYFYDEGNPRLRINHSYQQMIKHSETSKETRDFIKEKMRSAVDLLRNIEHRRQTIYRVAEAILNRQRGFLDYGVQYLKPMMLKNIAEDTGLHLSTISRVVNRKYAHTPQGIIELRRFFSEGMLNEDGEEISTRIIKLKIKKMIEAEDAKDPMTDDQIAKILTREGTKLSRRTIAKYRDQLKIPGSRERRLFV